MNNGRMFLISAAVCAGLMCGTGAFAQETASDNAALTEGQQWKAEIKADKEALEAQKAEIKNNAQEARQEEKTLREQIREARQEGNVTAASELREQLTTTHAGNVQQKKQDKEALHGVRQELNADRKAALKDWADANNDGSVDAAERTRVRKGRK